MEIRLIIAYALLALLAGASAFGLWWLLTREQRRRRRHFAEKGRQRGPALRDDER